MEAAMSSKKPVDRRQFVKSGFAAAAGVAAIGAVTGSACPVNASQLPEGDWWCIIREEPIAPPYLSQYWWLNCRTGEQRTTLGPSQLPLGNCVNAPANDSCIQSLIIDTWPKIEINGQTIPVEPDFHSRQGEDKIRSVVNAWYSER